MKMAEDGAVRFPGATENLDCPQAKRSRDFTDEHGERLLNLLGLRYENHIARIGARKVLMFNVSAPTEQ